MTRRSAGFRLGEAGSCCPGRRSETELAEDRLTNEAIEHLEAIVAYISAFNPAVAVRRGEPLLEVADSLAEFFERGRDVGDGRREMTTAWPYVLRYRVGGFGDYPAHRYGARDEYGELRA